MNQTIQLLQDIVRNARTGESGIEQLMEKTEDKEMRNELNREKTDYQRIAEKAEQALTAAGGKIEPLGMMAKAGMWMGTQMNTIMDKSNAHIAEMVIQGANMGVIELTKSRNTYSDAAPNALDIAADFITQQQDIIERQKNFLVDKVHA